MIEHFTINDDYVPDDIIRIKKLYRAILVRALSDLRFKRGTKIRREAFQWFDTWINMLPHEVSFKDVCETLEFTSAQIQALGRHIGINVPIAPHTSLRLG